MYGYATDETPEMMPLTIMLAHKMNMRMAECRRNGTLPWLRPDGKTQVQWKQSPFPPLFLLPPFSLSISPFPLSSPLPTSLPPLSFPPFHLSIHLSLSLSSLPLPSQVTVEYRVEDGACIPLRVHTVVISTQHDDDITLEEQRRQLKEEIIKVRG